jgi:hypothetical protein
MPPPSFTELIGEFMSTCGSVELVVNTLIQLLGRDPLLAEQVTHSPLARRIKVLSKLILDRTTLPAAEVKSLCKELIRVCKDRNVIAHNPIVTDADGANPGILVNREVSNFLPKTLTHADLERSLERANQAFKKLTDTATKIPGAAVPAK